jgi:DeoD family purine-nucleoside phosphorylase
MPCSLRGSASTLAGDAVPTLHIHPTASLADRVLLPGDPGRALRLAQELLEAPQMFNHNRGLWGYTGVAHDGLELTIQATGMGGPSAAIVVSELIELGARRFIRVGTCGSLAPELDLGRLLVVTYAISDDGASQALGAGESVPSSPGLLAGLLDEAGPEVASGPVVSTDLFYDAEERTDWWRRDGALAVEMETATLFALAERHQVDAASVLLVTDLLEDARERLEPEAMHAGEIELGRLALAGLIVA